MKGAGAVSLLGPVVLFIQFFFIVDQDEGISSKELLVNIRQMQDLMMKQQQSINVLSAPVPEGKQ